MGKFYKKTTDIQNLIHQKENIAKHPSNKILIIREIKEQGRTTAKNI